MLRIRMAESISELPFAVSAELTRALEALATLAAVLPSDDYRWDRLRDRTTGLLTAVVDGFCAYARVDEENAEVVVVAVEHKRRLLRWRQGQRLADALQAAPAPAPAR